MIFMVYEEAVLFYMHIHWVSHRKRFTRMVGCGIKVCDQYLKLGMLKDKSGVVIIADYSRYFTVVNGVQYFFSMFFSFNLRNYIFQSAKMCEMTTLHLDLNDTATCVDIIPLTLLASLSRLCKLVQNKQNGDDIGHNLRKLIVKFMKVGGIKTWKELTIGVQQLVRLLFHINFINPGLVL